MVVVDLPATTGLEVRAVNRNYVARIVPRILDLQIEPAQARLDEGGLEL